MSFREELSVKYLGKAIIGTLKGGIYDIGKILMAALWEAPGLKVIDPSVDISLSKFIETIRQASLREKVKIVIGGVPITEEQVRKIGAGEWTLNAISAVKLVKKLPEARGDLNDQA